MGMTRGQFFSLFMIVIGLAFIIYGWIKGPTPEKPLHNPVGPAPQR
jgi:hypothetical protein